MVEWEIVASRAKDSWVIGRLASLLSSFQGMGGALLYDSARVEVPRTPQPLAATLANINLVVSRCKQETFSLAQQGRKVIRKPSVGSAVLGWK